MTTDIEKIIEKLLHTYECVILPEFGGFIVRDSPCNFNAAGDKIKPYGKSVFFNPHLLQNDGLLINEIQKQNNLDYNSASAIYQSWLSEFRKKIEDTGSASFNKLGTFYSGNENSVWFTPNTNMNLAIESFGLFPVNVKRIVVQEELIEENIIPISRPNSLADRAPLEKTEPVRLNYKAWLVAASVALLAHLTYLGVEKNDVTINQASVIPGLQNISKKKDTASPAGMVYTNADNSDTVHIPVIENTVIESPEIINEVSETPIINETETPVMKEVQTVPAPVFNEPVIETTQKSETMIAKYRLESNARYHKNDLEKKGKTVEIRSADGWFIIWETEVPVQ